MKTVRVSVAGYDRFGDPRILYFTVKRSARVEDGKEIEILEAEKRALEKGLKAPVVVFHARQLTEVRDAALYQKLIDKNGEPEAIDQWGRPIVR